MAGAAHQIQPETATPIPPKNPPPVAASPSMPPPKPAPTPDQAKTQAALQAREAAEAARQPELTRQQKLADACEQRFLRMQELQGAVFSHRGHCAKCGWQTMQHDKESAHAMTRQHVLSHWKDVA